MCYYKQETIGATAQNISYYPDAATSEIGGPERELKGTILMFEEYGHDYSIAAQQVQGEGGGIGRMLGFHLCSHQQGAAISTCSYEARSKLLLHHGRQGVLWTR